MWYEILPSFTVITTLLSVSTIVTYLTNKLALDQPYRRRLECKYDNLRYLRDYSISKRKFAYDFMGLDNLPDEPETKLEEEEEKKIC